MQDWFYDSRNSQSYEEDSLTSKNPSLEPNKIKESKRKSLEEKVNEHLHQEYPEQADTLTFACYGLNSKDALLNYVESKVSTYQSIKKEIAFDLYMGGCTLGAAGLTSFFSYLALQLDDLRSKIVFAPGFSAVAFVFGFTAFSQISNAIKMLKERNKVLPAYKELGKKLMSCEENKDDRDLYNIYKETIEKHNIKPLSHPELVAQVRQHNKPLEEKDSLSFACYGLNSRDALLNYVENVALVCQNPKKIMALGLAEGGIWLTLAGILGYLAYPELFRMSDIPYLNILGRIGSLLGLTFSSYLGFKGARGIFKTIRYTTGILKERNKLLPAYEELERELMNYREDTKDEDLYNIYKGTIEKHNIKPLSHPELVAQVRDFNMFFKKVEPIL